MPTTVFISHSTKDQGFVEGELIPFLEGHGVTTWSSAGTIRTADEWETKIREGLYACDWFLLVMSPHSAQSDWVRTEVHWALEHRNGRLIPLLVDSCSPEHFHLKLARIQCLDCRHDQSAAFAKILHRLMPAAAPAAAPEVLSSFPEHDEYLRRAFIQRMRARYSGMPRVFPDGHSTRTSAGATYQEQELGETVPAETSGSHRRRGVEILRTLDETLRQHRRIVVVGPAGRGKSLLLFRIILRLAAALEEDGTGVVPVYVRLKDLVEAGTIRRYLEDDCGRELFPWVWAHFDRGNVWLLLDGLDEIPDRFRADLIARGGVLSDITVKLNAPQSKVIVTCRESAFKQVGRRLLYLHSTFVRVDLKPFTVDRVVNYAHAYFAGNKAASSAFLFATGMTSGASNFQSSRYLHLLIEPLHLSMLCWMWSRPIASASLSLTEEDLWDSVINAFLDNRGVPADLAHEPLRLLDELAFHKVFCGTVLTAQFVLSTATRMAEASRLPNPGTTARTWLEHLERWDLFELGRDPGGMCEFRVLSMDEYCAARRLVARLREQRFHEWFHANWPAGLRGMACGNADCAMLIPPVHRLLRDGRHEETMLLTCGLLGDADAARLIGRLPAARPARLPGVMWQAGLAGGLLVIAALAGAANLIARRLLPGAETWVITVALLAVVPLLLSLGQFNEANEIRWQRRRQAHVNLKCRLLARTRFPTFDEVRKVAAACLTGLWNDPWMIGPRESWEPAEMSKLRHAYSHGSVRARWSAFGSLRPSDLPLAGKHVGPEGLFYLGLARSAKYRTFLRRVFLKASRNPETNARAIEAIGWLLRGQPERECVDRAKQMLLNDEAPEAAADCLCRLLGSSEAGRAQLKALAREAANDKIRRRLAYGLALLGDPIEARESGGAVPTGMADLSNTL